MKVRRQTYVRYAMLSEWMHRTPLTFVASPCVCDLGASCDAIVVGERRGVALFGVLVSWSVSAPEATLSFSGESSSVLGEPRPTETKSSVGVALSRVGFLSSSLSCYRASLSQKPRD